MNFYSPTSRGFYDDAIHATMPGDVIEISDDLKASLFAAQSNGREIAPGQDGVPVALDPQPAQIWRSIQAERDRRKAGGYLVGTKWFHSDADSRIQQLGLVMLGANLPPGVQWKTMDGSFVEMTPSLAGQVFAAAAASDIAVFAAAEAHKAAMEASQAPHLYDWSGGWPAVYGE